MKRIFFAVLLTLVFAGCANATSALLMKEADPAKEPTNFRGIKWGAAINSIPGMEELPGGEKNVKAYIRINDKMSIGDARLEHVIYFFTNGKFDGVAIKATGKENASAILATLESAYGEDSFYNVAKGTHNWYFPTLTVTYKYNKYSEKVELDYFSLKEEKKREAKDRENAAEAQKDL